MNIFTRITSITFVAISLLAHGAEPSEALSWQDCFGSLRPILAKEEARPAQEVDLLVYAEEPTYIKSLMCKGVTHAQDADIRRLENALHVVFANIDELRGTAQNTLQSLAGTLQEHLARNRRRIVIIAKGSKETSCLLRFLTQSSSLADELTAMTNFNRTANAYSLDKPIHSVILINPTVAIKPSLIRSPEPISSTYCNNVYRRIYNFFNTNDYGAFHRHVYPAEVGIAADQDKNFYFKGVNIECQSLDKNGNLIPLKDEQMLLYFPAFADAITCVDRYHLHTTFNGVFKKATASGTLPFVWIRKEYKTEVKDNSPLSKNRQYLLLVKFAGKDTVNLLNYVSGTFNNQQRYQELQAIIRSEQFADYTYVTALDLPLSAHQEAAKPGTQKTLAGYAMIASKPKIVPTDPVAQVRVFDKKSTFANAGICRLEQDFFGIRKLLVQDKLRHRLDMTTIPLDNTPTIALVNSGGGSRAKFATLGALKALVRAGLFESTTYVCGLSGSTWALGALYNHLVRHVADMDRRQLSEEEWRNILTDAAIYEVIDKKALLAIVRDEFKEQVKTQAGLLDVIDKNVVLNILYTTAPDENASQGSLQRLVNPAVCINPIPQAALNKLIKRDTQRSLIERALLLRVINEVGERAAQNVHDFNFVKAFVGYFAERAIPGELVAGKTPTYIQVKKLCGQPVTNTDYYGAEIARTVLGLGNTIYEPNYRPSYLTDIQGILGGARYPMPIFTAGGISNKSDARPLWFEFSPYEVGAVLGEREGEFFKGVFISTQVFGNRYDGGICACNAPQMPLEFYLGVCGSALNVSVANLSDYLPPWMRSEWLNPDLRFAYAEVFNPVFNLPGIPEKYRKAATLGLFDAGLIFNLPLPVLNPHRDRPEDKGLRESRSADIVIFVDASDDNYSRTRVNSKTLRTIDSWPNGTTLRQAMDYAGKNSMSFPEIPNTGEINAPGSNVCSIYNYSRYYKERTALVVYYPVAFSAEIFPPDGQPNDNMQSVQNDCRTQINSHKLSAMQGRNFNEYYATQHTDLAPDQARMLMAIMEYNVLTSAPTVISAIKERIRGTAMEQKPTWTVKQTDHWLKLVRGSRTVDSLTLQECNEILKVKYPTHSLFNNVQQARNFIGTELRQELEHSIASTRHAPTTLIEAEE